MLVLEGMDIGYYSCIWEMQEGVIYYGTVRGRGMKDAKISVTRGGAIEDCMREGTSMKGGSISRGELQSFPLQRDTISNGMIPDEFRNFLFPIFVDKDEGIVAGITSIVFMPSFSRMDEFFLITHRDVQGCGKPFKECLWLCLLFIVVWINDVSEGWNVREVCDAVVLLVGDGEGNSPVVFSHRFDEGFKSFCDHINVVICFWVGCFITDDGFAKGNGVINLGLGRVYRFKD